MATDRRTDTTTTAQRTTEEEEAEELWRNRGSPMHGTPRVEARGLGPPDSSPDPSLFPFAVPCRPRRYRAPLPCAVPVAPPPCAVPVRRYGGSVDDKEASNSAKRPGPDGKYVPSRNLFAKSYAIAGGDTVRLSAEHPHALAIAAASPPLSVKHFANVLIISPRTVPPFHPLMAIILAMRPSRAPSDVPCAKFMLAHHSIHWSFVYRPKPPSGSPSIQANHSSVVCWNHRSL